MLSIMLPIKRTMVEPRECKYYSHVLYIYTDESEIADVRLMLKSEQLEKLREQIGEVLDSD